MSRKFYDDLNKPSLSKSYQHYPNARAEGKRRLTIQEEDELVRILRELCNLQVEVEQSKLDLVRQSDFNLRDAFEIFDVTGKGWVTTSEMKEAL